MTMSFLPSGRNSHRYHVTRFSYRLLILLSNGCEYKSVYIFLYNKNVMPHGIVLSVGKEKKYYDNNKGQSCIIEFSFNQKT